MKSERASNKRNKIYSMDVVKKNTTIESMHKDAPNQVWVCLKVDINEKSQGYRMKTIVLSCKWNLGKNELKLSIHLPNYVSQTLQA